MQVNTTDLRVGDRVCTFPDSYNEGYTTATVVRIEENLVYLERPYIYIDDHTMISFIGVERYSIYRDSKRPINRLFQFVPHSELGD